MLRLTKLILVISILFNFPIVASNLQSSEENQMFSEAGNGFSDTLCPPPFPGGFGVPPICEDKYVNGVYVGTFCYCP